MVSPKELTVLVMLNCVNGYLLSQVPPLEDHQRNGFRPGFPGSVDPKEIRTHLRNRKKNPQGAASNAAKFESSRDSVGAEGSIADLKKRFDVHVHNSSKFTRRGLFTGLSNAVDAQKAMLRKVVKDTVGLTKSALKGTIGLTRSALEDTVHLTKSALKGTVGLTKSALEGTAGLTKSALKSTVDRTKSTLSWMTDATVKIGKMMVSAPIQGVELSINAASALTILGVGTTAQIVSDTADWFHGNWEAVKAIDFPGKNLVVMLYPSGIMSVVDKLTREIMYLTDKGHEALPHVFAYTIYVSLKIVFTTVNTVMKLMGLDCVKLVPQKIELKKGIVNSIHTKTGRACGVSHLNPGNNVTITRNDDKFLIVKMPWVLNHLSVDLGSVNVTGLGGVLLDNEAMETKIEKVLATGTVSFEAGTLLRFVRIHIQVDEIIGLKINFKNPSKSYLMEGIEGMADAMSGIISKEINHVLSVVEEKVFKYIANI